MADTQEQNVAVEQKPKAEAAEPKQQPLRAGNQGKQKYGFWWGTGRRKTSVARVRIRPGSGKCIINKKEMATWRMN
jgi:hypothetical protein